MSFFFSSDAISKHAFVFFSLLLITEYSSDRFCDDISSEDLYLSIISTFPRQQSSMMQPPIEWIGISFEVWRLSIQTSGRMPYVCYLVEEQKKKRLTITKWSENFWPFSITKNKCIFYCNYPTAVHLVRWNLGIIRRRTLDTWSPRYTFSREIKGGEALSHIIFFVCAMKPFHSFLMSKHTCILKREWIA